MVLGFVVLGFILLAVHCSNSRFQALGGFRAKPSMKMVWGEIRIVLLHHIIILVMPSLNLLTKSP